MSQERKYKKEESVDREKEDKLGKEKGDKESRGKTRKYLHMQKDEKEGEVWRG